MIDNHTIIVIWNIYMGNFEKDLEMIFQAAMEKGNLSVALKAKETLAKRAGFFDKTAQTNINLDDLNHEQLVHLLQQIESRLDAEAE